MIVAIKKMSQLVAFTILANHKVKLNESKSMRLE